MQRLVPVIVLLAFMPWKASAQQAYFADGYHGGIYGHYPLWKTQFIVDKLAQYPEWKISLEIEPETWDTVQARTPEAYHRLKDIITGSRIEFTNPAYAQPYCYNISGESLIRQFEYGIRKIHQHFPAVGFTTYSAEEPCFTSCLPQLLKLFGFKYIVLKNPDTCWGGYVAAYGGELVNWLGPDGTSMLTVPRYACEDLEENSTWQTKAWNNSKSYLDACFNDGIRNPAGMCFQDAGWKNGPWIGYGDQTRNGSIYITWKDYIENISVGSTGDNRHYSQEDILVSLMWGSQVLQQIAQQVRTAENSIVMAEKIGVIAGLENNTPFPQEEADEAWRTLMLAQHHDSWIVPYNRLNSRHTWAQEIGLWTRKTNDIADRLIQMATGATGTGRADFDDGYIRVYNTSGTKRDEVVAVPLGREFAGKDLVVYGPDNQEVPSWTDTGGDTRLFFKAGAVPFGYTTYRLSEGKSRRTEGSGIRYDGGMCIMENDMYRIVIDPSRGGTIRQLVAKKEGNRDFAVRDGKYALGELRGHFYQEGRFHSSAEAPATVTLLEDHPFRTSVKIEGTIAGHPFTQVLTITRGQRRIDTELTIDWKENTGIGEYQQQGSNWRENRRAFYDDRFKLNVLFPVNLSSPRLYKNAPFDVCESRLNHTFFNSWDQIKHNIILHWVDLLQDDGAYGLALLSDHTTSYSFGDGFPLGLTAQYSGIGLWGVDYRITGPLKLKYAVIPHKGKWDHAAIATESSSWNEPLVCSLHHTAGHKTRSLIDVGDSGYEITAAHMKGDDVIVRLFNAEGNGASRRVTFNFPLAGVDEIDLNGRTISPDVTGKPAGHHLTVTMPRFGIRTYKIRRN